MKQYPTLQIGSKGEAVVFLQQKLQQAGFHTANDGLFGNDTAQKVIQLQQYFHLAPDGIVGQNTWQHLLNYALLQKKKLNTNDLAQIAKTLAIELPTLQALIQVEANGMGFLGNGKAKILFEGHIFWQKMTETGKNPQIYQAQFPHIVYPYWVKHHYKGGELEYERLNTAKKIDRTAALCATSWGMFQIMGYHFKVCGYSSVERFVMAQQRSEKSHLKAFTNFINAQNMIPLLQQKDWATFAYRYNGAGYRQNQYDTRLAQAYQYFKDNA
ncbi:MAG: DUF3380 domain-containing protein [Cytophagales bacterium]|nr:MAG: DUF3380 domain-containing protein [Cytophagales bacterium]